MYQNEGQQTYTDQENDSETTVWGKYDNLLSCMNNKSQQTH